MSRDKHIEIALQDAERYARPHMDQGKVATYIPELAKGDPTKLGICIRTPDGEEYCQGDCQTEFSIQSISKTITLILALQTAGYDRVFSKVGMEPTGDAFNSMIRLETLTTHPMNPMINAGAIATTSCCIKGCADPFGAFLSLARTLCGRETIRLNKEVFTSEYQAGGRNRAMAYFMQSENLLEWDAEDVVELYFKMCSINVNVRDLAHYGLVLACNGKDPATGRQLVDPWICRIVKTLMMTCGMYDASGEFAVKVGLPAKSGVGGGILASAEGRVGLATFAPGLDKRGNSIGGWYALEFLSQNLGLHCFSGHTEE